MAYALVGSVGTVVTGTSGTLSPAFGSGETPTTAGNLLVCWVQGTAAGGLPSLPSGWSQATAAAETHAGVYYKIAAGGDAAPTLTVSGSWGVALLAEFSGNATSAAVDQAPASATGTSSPLTSTAGSVDAQSGELVLASGSAFYSTAATKTLSMTQNGTSMTDAGDNNATSIINHYFFGYRVTTSNAAADSVAFSFTTTKISSAQVVFASFNLPPASTPIPLVCPVVSQAVNRSITY